MPNKTLAERYLATWNNHNAHAVTEYFVPDAVYIDTTLNTELIGRDAIRAHIDWIFDVCPDVQFELLEGNAIGNGRLSIEWIMHGSNLERFTDSAAENTKSIHGLDYIGYDNNGFLFAHVYFDHFPRRRIEHQVSAPVSGVLARYKRSGLSDDATSTLKNTLTDIMERDKVYLDPDLTLAKLANKLNSSTNYVSQVINGQYGLHFNDYISRYRIEHVKQILREHNDDSISMLDIAFTVGYGSSSAFYMAFKKHTQMTPKAFQQLHKAKA